MMNGGSVMAASLLHSLTREGVIPFSWGAMLRVTPEIHVGGMDIAVDGCQGFSPVGSHPLPVGGIEPGWTDVPDVSFERDMGPANQSRAVSERIRWVNSVVEGFGLADSRNRPGAEASGAHEPCRTQVRSG